MDRLEELTNKYRAVLDALAREGALVTRIELESTKLFMQAVLPSEEAKRIVVGRIEAVDKEHSDLISFLSVDVSIRLEGLKKKYQPVLDALEKEGALVSRIELRNNRLLIEGKVASQEAGSNIVRQVESIDKAHPDLTCNLAVDPSIRLEKLKKKYQPVLDALDLEGVRITDPVLKDDQLFIEGEAPSEAAKDYVWKQIRALDKEHRDLKCDLAVRLPPQNVVNGTPIDLILGYRPEDADGQPLGAWASVSLKSLETLTLDLTQFPAAQLHTVHMSLTLPGWPPLKELKPGPADREILVTTEQLLPMLGVIRFAALSPWTLAYHNTTDFYVDLYGVLNDGSLEFRGTLPPRYYSSPAQLEICTLIARAAFTGELLAMFVIGAGGPSYTFTITSDFSSRKLQARRQWLPSPLPEISSLHLVGEKPEAPMVGEKPEPPKVKRDSPDYVMVSEFDGPTREQFNTSLNAKTRRQRISAVELSSDAWPLNAYSSSAIKNLDSIEIYADRVIVSTPLYFPGTNVTIYARELEFGPAGQIDTTPHQFESAAITPKEKRDAQGKPKDYLAARGLNGDEGGDINIFVHQLKTPSREPERKRFIARGAKGQDGETGGLKDWKPKHAGELEGQAKDVPAITEQMIKDAFLNEGWFVGDGKYLNFWHWKGSDCYWPHCHTYNGRELFPEQGQGSVTYLKIIAYDDRPVSEDINYIYFPAKVRVWRPHPHHPNVWDVQDPEEVKKLARRPACGEDAYAGGKPGKGGQAGSITTSLPLDMVEKLCDLSPGEGGFTPRVDGGKPGKVIGDTADPPATAYSVTATIVKWGVGEGFREPRIEVTEYPRIPGDSASEQRGDRGGKGEIKSVSRSFLHPEVLDAVIACAKDAYRNEDRQLARDLMEPYYGALRGSSDVELKGPLAAMECMRGKLLADLDYYGNPPGWVPRLNLRSAFEQFQQIHNISQSLCFYARNMSAKYDTLENGNLLAQETSNAITAELGGTRTLLNDAVTALANARETLDEVAQKVKQKQGAIDTLNAWATAKAADRVAAQRIFRGVMKTIGGLMKAFPIGQPYVGVAGDITSGIGDFNWNDPKGIGGQIGNVLGGIGGAADKFLKDNKDLIVKDAVPRALRDKLKLDEQTKTDLTEQIKEATGAITADEAALKREADAWTTSKKAELEDLKEQLSLTVDNLKKGAEIAQMKDEDKTEALRKLTALTAWSEGADATNVVARKKKLEGTIKAIEEQAPAAKSDAERKVLSDLKKKVSDLKDSTARKELELKNTVRKTARDSQEIKEKEAQRGETLDRLKGIGSGISTVGQGLASLMTPVAKDDPEVANLATYLLDSEKNEEFTNLMNEFRELGKKQSAALAILLAGQARAAACVSSITQNLAELNALAWQRQAMEGVLDIRVKRYLKDMESRATDALRQSIYTLIMAYRYEHLTDVSRSFFNFDKVVKQLAGLEGAADKPSQLEKWDPANFAKVPKADEIALKKELLEMALPIIDRRNRVAGDKENEWPELSLSRQQLSQLRLRGRVAFNLVRDFHKGSFSDANVRLVDITDLKLNLAAKECPFSLRATFWHSGKSIIKSADRPDCYYFFQAGPLDDPIFWAFNYTLKKDGSPEIKADTIPSENDQFLRELLAAAKDPNNPKEPGPKPYREHLPSFFSDVTLVLTYGDDKFWNPNRVTSIENLEFKVKYHYARPGR